MRLAAPNPEDISFDDIELLDDVMRYGTLGPVAQKRKITQSSVGLRLKNATWRLEERIARLEGLADSERRLAEAHERIAQLEQELSDSKVLNDQLEEKVKKVAEYNRILTVAKAQESQLNGQYRNLAKKLNYHKTI